MVLRRIKAIGKRAHGALKRALAERHAAGRKQPVPEAVRIPRNVLFAIRQIGSQSKQFPELAGLHNRLLKQHELHQGGALKITGDAESDARLMRNFGKMALLKEEISTLRTRAKSRKLHDKRERAGLTERAARMEQEFNGLKAENAEIFGRFYGKG